MSGLYRCLATLFLAFFLFASHAVFSQTDNTAAETVVHLLSYVSMDYPGAVQDGKVIDESEYNEQKDFSEQAYKLVDEGHFLKDEDKMQILIQIKELINEVHSKASAAEISIIANKVKGEIITLTGIQTAPSKWPSLENGQKLFTVTCAPCHGQSGNGDGPLGESLDPQPSNFHDAELMGNFSAFQAYNSIRLGVPGTAMVPYPNYSDAELWDLAFYVKSIRFRDSKMDTLLLRNTFEDIYQKVGLANVANLTDNELLDSIKLIQASKSDNQAELAALRLLRPTAEQAVNSLPTAIQGLKDAMESYTAGNRTLARTQAISAYLEGIEPVEAQLRTKNSDFVASLETQMFNVRQAIEKDKGPEIVKEEVDKALAIINQAQEMMQSQKLNYWLTFIIAASIFLREALEAFLIIAVVLALIKSANAKKALPWLHGGWITAVVAGIAGWFLSGYIVKFGGRNREVMEGLVSLFAVAVLIFVGFWLHSKTEARQWTHFIKDKIGGYLKKDRMLGLAVFSFIVVFREAFEVILFLQAVSLEAAQKNQSAIGLGVVAAALIVVGIAYAFLKYSKMVPVRQLFRYSSWIIVLLAIILMGKGIHSLQESGWVSVTNIKMFRAEWLGIYPSLQTLLGQIALVILIVGTFVIRDARAKKEMLKKT